MLSALLESKYLMFLVMTLFFWGVVVLVRYFRQRRKPPYRDLATRLKERQQSEGE